MDIYTISAGGSIGKIWDIGNSNNTGIYVDSPNIFFDVISLNFKIGISF